MPSGQSAEGENVSDIQTLTNRIQELSQSVDFWNLVMLWGLLFAALTAAWIGVSTRLVIVRSGQLGDAQSQLSDAKDRQLKADLGEKDRQIANLNLGTEQLKAANLALQQRLAWRRITKEQHDEFVAALKPYAAGSKVALVDVGSGDEETRTFTEDIGAVLHDASWEVTPRKENIIPVPRGLICVIDESTPAGRALSKVMHKLPMARFRPGDGPGEGMIGSTAPVGMVAAISVGIRPAP